MNTFWLKIAALAIAVVAGIIVIGSFTGGDSEPKEPERTIYDQWQEDDERLTAEPEFKEPPAPVAAVQAPEQTVSAPKPVAVEPPKPQFKQLSAEEDFQAQKLWIWVENQRKMGRLPVVNYGQMVKTCREIIQRWPESEYAFFAKRALGDLPERYHRMYNITKEEIDLGNLK
jgi:type IV secretory pathway VirB10-like protein